MVVDCKNQHRLVVLWFAGNAHELQQQLINFSKIFTDVLLLTCVRLNLLLHINFNLAIKKKLLTVFFTHSNVHVNNHEI